MRLWDRVLPWRVYRRHQAAFRAWDRTQWHRTPSGERYQIHIHRFTDMPRHLRNADPSDIESGKIR
jgi:hypothetical protein